MPIAGLLIAHHGWEAVFYVFGGAGVAFVFLWMLLVYDSPTKHPYITDAEKALLQTSLENEMAQNRKVRLCWFKLVFLWPELFYCAETLNSCFEYMRELYR